MKGSPAFDLERNTSAAGAYVLYDGYFVFMFGFGSNHTEHELGVVRFGGHLEEGETIVQCIEREVKEESSLDITFLKTGFHMEGNITAMTIKNRRQPGQ